MIKINDFLDKPLNKFILWLLTGLLILLVGIFPVKADIVQYKFIDYVSTSSTMKQTNFATNETFTYSRDYVLFNGNDKFFAFNYCATGPFDFSFPNDFEGVTSLVGYSTGGSCYVQGYEGYNYTVYFMAKQVHDAGNGNLSIMFNTTVHNRTSYTVFINVLSLSQVSSIPAGVQIPTYDGEFTTLNTKIDSVDQAIVELQQTQNQMISEQQNTTNSIDNVNDTLNDDTAPETPDFSDLDVADDSVISDLVTMPITIAEHILDAFNDTCSNYTIPFFNNTSLTLPCFTIGDYVGNNVASVIDLAIILFMIYNIAMLAISAFNDLTSLRDSYDSLYVPQHGPHSYEPRHGKE